MTSVPPPRFAADVMLGKTAKWLRMLGVDTFYDNKANDADLQTLCLREVRVLLTKDVALHAAMPAGTSRLVEAVHPREQLREIVSAFHLDRSALPPRCSLCNGELAAIEKEMVGELVPPYVFRTQDLFQRCSQCHKIYWQGTHLGKINKFIENIRKFSG
ncbi:MAG: Mut7-C RNAse domain-containing protein [Candidatus Aminicenantes bacterium]|nr:Mut7-C RNAse domain-containing protein [Candidatus Aminicenantes bacterium]